MSLSQWQSKLKSQAKPDEILTSSQFWVDSRTAFETGLYDKFWDLPIEWRAWLIAVVETKDLLQRARDFVDDQKREAEKKAQSKGRK
jgi:hypothetical protein